MLDKNNSEFYDIVGLITEQEWLTLTYLAEQVKENGKIIEIGSYMGKSTVGLAKGAHTTVSIDAIDLFPEETTFLPNDTYVPGFPKHDVTYKQRLEFIKNTKKYPNIRMIIADNASQLDYKLEPHIDLLFLDANHRNPIDLDYLKYFIPRMKVGGIISGHDFISNFPDVISNVKMLENYYSTKATIIETLWYVKVTK